MLRVSLTTGFTLSLINCGEEATETSYTAEHHGSVKLQNESKDSVGCGQRKQAQSFEATRCYRRYRMIGSKETNEVLCSNYALVKIACDWVKGNKYS